jgi:hypothetical protein
MLASHCATSQLHIWQWDEYSHTVRCFVISSVSLALWGFPVLTLKESLLPQFLLLVCIQSWVIVMSDGLQCVLYRIDWRYVPMPRGQVSFFISETETSVRVAKSNAWNTPMHPDSNIPSTVFTFILNIGVPTLRNTFSSNTSLFGTATAHYRVKWLKKSKIWN